MKQSARMARRAAAFKVQAVAALGRLPESALACTGTALRQSVEGVLVCTSMMQHACSSSTRRVKFARARAGAGRICMAIGNRLIHSRS